MCFFVYHIFIGWLVMVEVGGVEPPCPRCLGSKPFHPRQCLRLQICNWVSNVFFISKKGGGEFVHSSAVPTEGNFWHKKSPHPEGCELSF